MVLLDIGCTDTQGVPIKKLGPDQWVFPSIEAAQTAKKWREGQIIVPLVERQIGKMLFRGHDTIYQLALGEYLFVNYLFTRMSRNGNSSGYVQLMLRDSNGMLCNESKNLAEWFGFKFSEKWNAVILSKHGTWVSTVEQQIRPHFENKVAVLDVLR